MRRDSAETNMLFFVRWAQCIKFCDATVQHTQTGVCTIKRQTKASAVCRLSLGTAALRVNKFKLPPATPRLFIHPHPPTLTLSRLHSEWHICTIHPISHLPTTGPTERDCTSFGYCGGERGSAAVFKCISTQTCWNLTDEASWVKLCFVEAYKDSD